jgi:hypothetical protein
MAVARTIVTLRSVRAGLLVLAVALPSVLAMPPAAAQNWQWPWESKPKSPPIPVEPVQRPPAVQQQGLSEAPLAGWGPRSTPICLQLEQRLVQESQRGDQSRNLVPMVESEIRQVEQQQRTVQRELDRSNCFDVFLFSKTLRRTAKCVDLWNEVEGARRRLADLDTQRAQLLASAGHSYQDDIIRELARNNCGANYEQQARRRDSNPFSSLWSEEESTGTGGLGSFSNLPYATYRTVCVRLCDGYFFPVSFSTLPNHFERDAQSCQSKCAAPAELYYYQNPGGSADQMVGYRSSTPYTELKSAFRYRKEYVSGCSCKVSEYLPEGGTPRESGEAAPGEAGGNAVSTAAAPGSEDAGSGRAADNGEKLPWAPR